MKLAKKYITVALRVHGALLLGVIITIWFLQHDPWLKTIIEQSVCQSFTEILGTEFKCKVKEINVLNGEIVFEHLEAKDTDNTWRFKCPTCVVHFSWLSFLAHSRFSTDIVFYHAQIYSNISYNAGLSIVKPIQAIVEAPSRIPLELKRCSLRQASLESKDSIYNTDLTLLFSSDTFFVGPVVSTTLSCADGVLCKESQHYGQKITGTVKVDIPIVNPKELTINMHIAADVPLLKSDNKRALLTGVYKHNNGSAEFRTLDGNIDLKVPSIHADNNKIVAHIKLWGDSSACAAYTPLSTTSTILPGIISLEGSVTYTGKNIEYRANGYCDMVRYGRWQVPRLLFNATGTDKEVSGSLNMAELLNGTFNWDIIKSEGFSSIIVKKPLVITPTVKIEPEATHGTLTFKDKNIKFTYKTRISGLLGKPVTTITGKVLIDAEKFTARIQDKDKICTLAGTCAPFSLAVCEYNNKQKQLIKLSNSKNNSILAGSLDYTLLKEIIEYIAGYKIKGEGIFTTQVQLKDNKIIVTLGLTNGNIRIPSVYNLLKDIHAIIEIDIENKCIIIKDIKLNLYKGKIYSLVSTLRFSDSWNLVYAHVPLSCKDCLITWKKEFFGLLSGIVTAVYNKAARSSCTGALWLDKSQFRGNLLSGKVQKDFVGQALRSLEEYKDITLDMGISTRSPIAVHTSFLDTNARINTCIKGTLSNPELSGAIELLGGSLGFPYKPLYISAGKIYIMPHQLEDPVIELTAKNKIKKYGIVLSVTGSAQQPKITLESLPTLPEEQILALLLSGSEEASFYLVMPNVIMQNLESLLFGPAEQSSKLQRYLKSFLKPFKNVRITPALTDDTAQGKEIKGSVEIDINDRLHAKIQKSLDLTESPHVEVEYTLSDDTSIKAIKNQRDGLGAEVEMRWKF